MGPFWCPLVPEEPTTRTLPSSVRRGGVDEAFISFRDCASSMLLLGVPSRGGGRRLRARGRRQHHHVAAPALEQRQQVIPAPCQHLN